MNVFVIHYRAYKDKTEEIVSSLKKKAYSFNTLILKNKRFFWKVEASQKIRKSQMVLFVAGGESYKSPYIAWEIKEAIKHKKPIYVLKLEKDCQLHPALNTRDPFSAEEKPYGKPVKEEELLNLIKSYDSGDYGLFNGDLSNLDQTALLEQYKLFLQTSEDLVSRRQNVNSFYISISSALAALMSVLLAMDFSQSTELTIGFIFCMIGIILSVSWSRSLSCYGNLNSSKMKIISSIEKQLPLSLFDAEWAALSDKLNKKKYVSFTDSEKIVPRLFAAVYIVIMLIMLVSVF